MDLVLRRHDFGSVLLETSASIVWTRITTPHPVGKTRVVAGSRAIEVRGPSETMVVPPGCSVVPPWAIRWYRAV